ncbi:hypothetical protein EDB81DRAFT_898381 [Dactylonectria macrodidyma]|uniref:Protein kinase domain-containing protein n=1 Tax=Dactylonectria macrodidyma TaxID=307937 RepID=A0A9P9FVT2_9HYPO|nr:hypothetical protein EDB81DRAFT_898381 [Dactylonectria macrodidyma]
MDSYNHSRNTATIPSTDSFRRFDLEHCGPSMPINNHVVDTNFIGGGPLLQFRYASLKSDLPLILSDDLKEGKYLAQGQCSQVMVATWKNNTIAVKRIIRRTPGERDRREIWSKVRQLQRDIEVCSHPQLVKSGHFPTLVGYGVQDGLPFLALELATIGSLDRMLYTEQEWTTRLDILIQVATAIKALHENGIQHGDIKPENVLIYPADGKYCAKLSDFSHASYGVAAGVDNPYGAYYGTWPFIPIEVWTKPSSVTVELCDIWTYGLLLWRVCQYRNDDSPKILSFVPSMDKDLNPAHTQALEKLWVEAFQRLSSALSGSETVDIHARSNIVSLFSDCVLPDPRARPSSAKAIERLCCLTEPRRELKIEEKPDHVEELTLSLGSTTLQGGDQEPGSSSAQPEQITLAARGSPPWIAETSRFSLFRMFSDRSSWHTQREFAMQLARAANNPPPGSQSFFRAVLSICQAYGYGCMRNIQPLVDLVEEEKRSAQEQEHTKVTREYDPERERSEIPVLRLLDGIMQRALRVGFSNLLRDEPESAYFLRDAADMARDFREREPYSLLWSAMRHGFPYAACILKKYNAMTEVEPVFGSTALHMLWTLTEDALTHVGRALVPEGTMLETASQGRSFICPRNMLVLEGTPLLWAVKAGNLYAATLLVSLGAQPLNSAGSSTSPLEAAVSLYRPEMVDLFLGHNFLPRIESPSHLSRVGQEVIMGFKSSIAAEHERTILHGTAVREMAAETLKIVLQHWPSQERAFLLEMLLQMSSTTSYQSQLGTAALVPYLLEVLLELRSSITPSPLPANRTSVVLNGLIRHWLLDGENCEQLLEHTLERHGSLLDPNTRDEVERTALHTAAIFNVAPLIPILLHHGAEIDAKDCDGNTPLFLAARMASVESFEALLDAGAKVACDGISALHAAATPQTKLSLIHYMLFESRHRARFTIPQILDGREPVIGATPLCLSVLAMQLDAIKALMLAGANCRAATCFPKLPIVMSVREIATMTYYKPGMKEGLSTWQRHEAIDPEEDIRNSKAILMNFYSGCKASDYEEEGFIGFNDNGVSLNFHVRKKRPGETFDAEFVSLDVLPRRPLKHGVSMWDDEIDLLDGEEMQFRRLVLPR